LASDDFFVCCQECFLYIYTGVGLSALLVSDEQDNAKALTSGTPSPFKEEFITFKMLWNKCKIETI